MSLRYQALDDVSTRRALWFGRLEQHGYQVDGRLTVLAHTGLLFEHAKVLAHVLESCAQVDRVRVALAHDQSVLMQHGDVLPHGAYVRVHGGREVVVDHGVVGCLYEVAKDNPSQWIVETPHGAAQKRCAEECSKKKFFFENFSQ